MARANRSINPFRVLLTHRDFRLFWVGQTLSLMGTWMQVMAEGWLALELSDSPLLVGLVRVMAALPIVAFSFVAGAVADRQDKLRLVRTMQACMLVSSTILWWLVWSHHITIHLLLLLATVNGSLAAFEIPARQSMMVDFVGRDDLHAAIALNSSGFNLARIIGPAVGALIISSAGLAWCYGANALSYVAVLIGLSLIARPVAMAAARQAVPVRTALAEIYGEMRDGLRYIGHTSPIDELMLLVVVFSVGAVPYLTLMPVMARDVLGIGAGGYGAMMTCVGIGGLAGALFLASFGQRLRRGRLLRVSAFGFPLSLIAFSLAPRPAIAYAILLVAGGMMILNGALANGILQSLVDDAYRGRLMAVYSFVVVGIGDLVGSGMSGWVAERVGADWTIRGAALLVMAYAGWAYGTSTKLKRL